ncbi:hypothetical protein [Flavobacterium silvaticum]|uniref:Uncharacterized protein n=1 Tax=Flavobacterium silvaticum TaxID=1852020 RepID=A0A972FJD3_9FLAO|nr:hypothetical protein [Flavobacterium silvaticum]NMH27129.1 hypothetical protein [Flavobacterium silvaticum]
MYEIVYRQFEKGFLGSCALTVLLQSCVGGISAMAVLHNGNSLPQMIQLFLVVTSSLAVNGAIISVQPPKTVFNLLLLGQLTCIVLGIVNFVRFV